MNEKKSDEIKQIKTLLENVVKNNNYRMIKYLVYKKMMIKIEKINLTMATWFWYNN